jgi:HAD superfamily hydrolase (TIGR01549 family)
VFANLPAAGVARELERLTEHQFDTDDPLEVLRHAYALDPTTGHRVEDALVRTEVDAVRVSTPEVAGVAALRSLAQQGRLTAVVSNNSTAAVEKFLDMHELRHAVTVVVGRAHRRPDLMKPNPWPLLRAAEELGVEPGDAVLIGDSLTDIEAARSAGTYCVAFANKPSKVAPFRAAGVPIVMAMEEIDPSRL